MCRGLLCTIPAAGPGTFGFRALLRRGRISADLADTLRGTPVDGLLRDNKSAVLGDFDASGAMRACPADTYFDALEASPGPSAVLGIPLCRTTDRGRMVQANGRPLWDLVEDSDVRKWVPNSPADPSLLTPALDFILTKVLRSPKFHPSPPPLRHLPSLGKLGPPYLISGNLSQH